MAGAALKTLQVGAVLLMASSKETHISQGLAHLQRVYSEKVVRSRYPRVHESRARKGTRMTLVCLV